MHLILKNLFLLLLFSINVLLSLSSVAQDSLTNFDLSGTWDFKAVELNTNPNYRDSEKVEEWQKVQVPSNWYLQGIDTYGKVWYQKKFTFPLKYKGKFTLLRFKGIDYAADIWLNGNYLGHHQGYFQPFDFDVSKNISHTNLLTVLVDSPIEDPSSAWSLKKKMIKGVFSHHDTRPGGAWSPKGQDKNTGGIWAPVYIKVSESLALKRVEVLPQKSAKGWVVNSTLSLSSKLPKNSKISVEGTIEPKNFTGRKFKFKSIKKIVPGESKFLLSTVVINPKLWWPAGNGNANLYRIKLKLKKNGHLLDQEDTVFGFRELLLNGKTQEWYINGHRMFIRGTNYISSQWLSEMSRKKYSEDVKLMQAANINAVRVHAHIEAETFYKVCDEKGLLVFQDFPLQWGYLDDLSFINDARSQVQDMVHTLNNHPSIVEWTLHNEPPWDASWMQYKYTDYDPNQNRLLDDFLYQDVKEIESSRNVRKQSSTLEHAWIGWYYGNWKDVANPTNEAWISEFGAQALPNYNSLRKIFSDEDLWPDNEKKWEKWTYHNFQKHETFDIAGVKQGKDISEFIQNTQLYQANLIKLAAESYRRQRYAPVTAIFQFMFVEDWPSINWGVVDYWRTPKLAYKAITTAYQPILPSIEWTNESFSVGDTASFGLWIINDLWKSYFNANYQVTVLKDGQTLESKSYNVDVLKDTGKKLDDFKILLATEGSYVLKVKVLSNESLVLGQNQYDFMVKAK